MGSVEKIPFLVGFDTGVRVAGPCRCEVGGEHLLEYLERAFSSKHLIETMPTQQQRLVVGYPAQALRHPEVNVLGARLGLNSSERSEIERHGMVLETVIILIG